MFPPFAFRIVLEKAHWCFRGFRRTFPHGQRLRYCVRGAVWGLAREQPSSQGWSACVQRHHRSLAPLNKYPLSGRVAVYACRGAARDLRARLWPEAISEGDGEESERACLGCQAKAPEGLCVSEAQYKISVVHSAHRGRERNDHKFRKSRIANGSHTNNRNLWLWPVSQDTECRDFWHCS